MYWFYNNVLFFFLYLLLLVCFLTLFYTFSIFIKTHLNGLAATRIMVYRFNNFWLYNLKILWNLHYTIYYLFHFHFHNTYSVKSVFFNILEFKLKKKGKNDNFHYFPSSKLNISFCFHCMKCTILHF